MWFISLLLLVLISVESLVRSQEDYYPVIEKREGTKYCGKNLADALRLVCGGFYNSMFSKRKTDPGNIFQLLFIIMFFFIYFF